MKLFKYIGLSVLLFSVAGLTVLKPVKILMPEVAGVKCVEEWLRIDDLSRLEEARNLYENGLNRVESKLTKFDRRPKFVFCSSLDCYSKLGFSKSAANSIAAFGVVVAPRGWRSYCIEHELIHQWQSESFGFMSTWLAPGWVTEGMAYFLSDDPRDVLSEPFEGYRIKYGRVFGQLSGLELKLALEGEI